MPYYAKSFLKIIRLGRYYTERLARPSCGYHILLLHSRY